MKGKLYMNKMIRNLSPLALMAVLAVPAVTPRSKGAEPAPLTSASAQRNAADLETLVAPIALYPDPLIAVVLSASVYPADVVYAARFVANHNNLAGLEDQPWDAKVKAVAGFPSVAKKMNDDLGWTVALGQAFTQQPLEVMDAIQVLRGKAQSAGTLQTTPEQVVSVSEAVVERAYDAQIVYVTNTVVQITPANPEVIYVPEYNHTIIYDPQPAYVYDSATPLIYFGSGIPAGAIIVNNHPDWYYGGVYFGPGRVPVWVGFGPRPYYAPPPSYWPPRHYPSHRPPPFGNHPRPPGNAPKPPGNPPQSPGNTPKPPGNSPRPPSNPPQSPGNAPRPPRNPPQSPGNSPRPPGNPPQSPGNSPRPPGNPPQSPANSPRPRGNSAQSPNDSSLPPRDHPFPPGNAPTTPPAPPRPFVNPPPSVVRKTETGSKPLQPSIAPKK
jgi:hypothetical protein